MMMNMNMNIPSSVCLSVLVKSIAYAPEVQFALVLAKERLLVEVLVQARRVRHRLGLPFVCVTALLRFEKTKPLAADFFSRD